MAIANIGTYLPPWGKIADRVVGLDEDAVTIGVAAGRGAIGTAASAMSRHAIGKVVFVTRDFPLLVGGNAAALLAGLGLNESVAVDERLGGAATVIDAITNAEPTTTTLIIGADAASGAGGAGAAAVLCSGGSKGATLTLTSRVHASMPVMARDSYGHTADYFDPRLLREFGIGSSLQATEFGNDAAIVAGLRGKDAASLCAGALPALPTTGASSAIFALAALAETAAMGTILAIDQASIVLAALSAGPIVVTRNEAEALAPNMNPRTPGPEIAISLAAYERAFSDKLRLQAAQCVECKTLAYPRRFRCLECGCETPSDTVDLPRNAEAYSVVTIRTQVPGLISPYTLVMAELGDSGVRLLVQLTGATAGAAAIGDQGTMVFRRVAVRSGVPDYGYGFLPTPAGVN